MSRLRDLARPAVRAAREARAWSRGAALRVADRSAGVAVSYGHETIPGPNEPAVGGIVKLQHLAREFPNQPRHFNVLYLVTSRLPEGAVTLARWAKRKGARVIVNQNGVAYPGWHGPGWEAVNAPMRDLLALADHVFYQSEFCRISADRFAGPPHGRWEVLHNAVDTASFAPQAVATERPLTLLLGGSQDVRYRVESAVRTVAVLTARGRDVRLIITGRIRWDGNADRAAREVHELIASHRLDDRVRLVGPYAQADAPELFRSADILLHTKYNDPCPAVVVEALATGLPVVHSASGGVPELVGEAGIGVPAPLDWDRDIPPDPEALASAVERVVAQLPHLARHARERAVAHLGLEHWMARHRAVFAGEAA